VSNGDDNDNADDDDKESLFEPFTEELKTLYFGKWETPSYLLDDDDDDESELSVLLKIDHGNVSSLWYIYAIIISVVGAIVYNIIIGRWKYVKKVVGWNANDEYIAIPGEEIEGI